MVVLDPSLTKILVNKNEDIELLPWDQLFERFALGSIFPYLSPSLPCKEKINNEKCVWLFIGLNEIHYKSVINFPYGKDIGKLYVLVNKTATVVFVFMICEKDNTVTFVNQSYGRM